MVRKVHAISSDGTELAASAEPDAHEEPEKVIACSVQNQNGHIEHVEWPESVVKRWLTGEDFPIRMAMPTSMLGVPIAKYHYKRASAFLSIFIFDELEGIEP